MGCVGSCPWVEPWLTGQEQWATHQDQMFLFLGRDALRIFLLAFKWKIKCGNKSEKSILTATHTILG